MRTFGEALGQRDNALNFVRLILAAAVMVWHTFIVGGYPAPAWAYFPGEWGVDGFFAVSGYLIWVSRERTTASDYFWRRAARIFPAFWAVLAVTAFVFSPIASRLRSTDWSLASAVSYVIDNSLLTIRQPSIYDPATIGVGSEWNGSLWTLSHEFRMYIVAGLLLSLSFVRRRQLAVTLGVLAGFTLATAAVAGPLRGTGLANLFGPLRLGAFFAAGMVFAVLRHRLVPRRWLALASVGALGVLSQCGDVGEAFGPIPLAYLCLWAGSVLPLRVGAVNDVSYGVYIYAMPVQWLVSLSVGRALPAWYLHLLVTAPITVAFAWASWVVVERPALNWVRRSRTAAPADAPATGRSGSSPVGELPGPGPL